MYAGRYVRSQIPGLTALGERQARVVTRLQLTALGVTADEVARHVAAGRWAVIGPLLVVLHTGPLSPAALRWAAVLNAGTGTGLCAWSALAQWGLRGWPRPDVHVVVVRGSTPYPLPWVRVHESRRHSPEDLVVPQSSPPAHGSARAAVDAAAWERDDRSASGVLLASVQQRIASITDMVDALELAGRVRRRRLIRSTLAEAAGGADALSEVDLTSLCVEYGLPVPRRQVMRLDSRGRQRFRDVEWLRADGVRVVAEIDGRGHADVSRWYDDLLRDAELATVERETIRLRLPAPALRADRPRVAQLLRGVLLA